MKLEKKLQFVFLLFFNSCIFIIQPLIAKGFQQNNPRIIKGKIVSMVDKKPIENATILVMENSKVAVKSNLLGEFNLPVQLEKFTLKVSAIGYEAFEKIWTDNTDTITIVLTPSVSNLETVVVTTSLGIKKELKALPYAVTVIKGTDFSAIKEPNFANSLVGKVAGVNVSSYAQGPSGSSRVIIRGNGSLNGNNQPLYIVNDLPLDNTLLGLPRADGFASDPIANGLNFDKGDGIQGINPDDIESITVLKGGTAAALYGSLASNGVIVITTKKGKQAKGLGVEFNSTITFEKPLVFTDWQYEYGVGNGGVKPSTQAEAINWGRLSWGAKIDGTNVIQFDGVSRPYIAQKNNIQNFYKTGVTKANTISLSGGTDKLNARFSFSNFNTDGIVPNNSLNRTILNLSVDAQISNWIKFDIVSQYNSESVNNPPTIDDAFGNPNWGTYLMGNTIDIRDLKAVDNNGVEQAWNSVPIASNPNFVISKFSKTILKDRFINTANLTISLYKGLQLKARIGKDLNQFKFEGIVPVNALYTPLGGYQQHKSTYSNTNAELLLNYNKSNLVKNINLNTLVGVGDRTVEKDEVLVQGQNFILPNLYSITNLSTLSQTYNYAKSVTRSAFGSLDLDYKSAVFLNVTGRQDWFSTLNINNNNILYPSFGTSIILSELINMPTWINFSKFRTSWAQVGGAIPTPYSLNLSYNLLQSGQNGQPLEQVTSSRVPNPNLQPLTSTNYEIGYEGKFFQNRLNIDIAWYKRSTTNDIVETTISSASGYRTALLNIGQVTNQGFELFLGINILTNTKLKWSINLNGSYNENVVNKISDNLNNIVMASSVNGYAYIYSQVGRPYSVIFGRGYTRDASGNIIYNVSNGIPVPVASNLKEYGLGVAPTIIGFTNEFKYKNFKLNILIDGKFGGSIYTATNLYATRLGLNKITLPGRENGLQVKGVDPKGNPVDVLVPVSKLSTYYDNLKNISELFIYSSDFVKLRQVILSYTFPTKNIKCLQKINNLSVSFVARNLFILYKNTPNVDPESLLSADNAQGIEQFGVPRTASYGINLNFNF